MLTNFLYVAIIHEHYWMQNVQRVDDFLAIRLDTDSPQSDHRYPADLSLSAHENAQASMDDLYEEIYLAEAPKAELSVMLFRCCLVAAAALVVITGTQLYKGYHQAHKTTIGTANNLAGELTQNAQGPGIDPMTTSSITSPVFPDEEAVIVEERDFSAPPKSLTYVVQPGDTLTAIGKRHGIKPARIMTANKIEDANIIRPGMVLIIDQPRQTDYTNGHWN